MHVIIGAGVGGLYIATRLINKGINPNSILIIEKRAINHYTRPGHLNTDSFELVAKNTNIPTPHSSADHIKELERAMYNHLEKLSVAFINEAFVGLQAKTTTQCKAVITCKIDQSQGIYPAEYVYDCSGAKASVVQAVNAYQQSINSEPAFESRFLVDVNPIQDHLVAHVRFQIELTFNTFLALEGEALPPHLATKSLQEKIRLRESLIHYGWTYEAFPTFYNFTCRYSKKVCLYMETPPNLDTVTQKYWMRLLLSLYTKDRISEFLEIKPSKKYGVKPRIVGFQSIPYVLNKVVHESDNLPTVFVGFDALKGFDYRKANGTTSGIECSEYILNNIEISNGNIHKIDTESIEKKTFDYIHGAYKTNLEERLANRQKSIENALEYFSNIYETAAKTLLPFTLEFRQNYQAIACTLAYQAMNEQSRKLHKNQLTGMDKLEVINKCLSMLLRAKDLLLDSDIIQHHTLHTKCTEIIASLCAEICVFDIEKYRTQDHPAIRRVRQLFERIENNFQKLENNKENLLITDAAKSALTSMLSQIEQNLLLKNRSPLGENPFSLFAIRKNNDTQRGSRLNQQSFTYSPEIYSASNCVLS